MEARMDMPMAHDKLVTDEGWVDCTCGWQSNHPRLPTREEAKVIAAVADVKQPELLNEHLPVVNSGDPDPEHVGNELPWNDHYKAEVQAHFASMMPAPTIED